MLEVSTGSFDRQSGSCRPPTVCRYPTATCIPGRIAHFVNGAVTACCRG